MHATGPLVPEAEEALAVALRWCDGGASWEDVFVAAQAAESYVADADVSLVRGDPRLAAQDAAWAASLAAFAAWPGDARSLTNAWSCMEEAADIAAASPGAPSAADIIRRELPWHAVLDSMLALARDPGPKPQIVVDPSRRNRRPPAPLRG